MKKFILMFLLCTFFTTALQISINKPANASSEYNNKYCTQNINDGNLSTVWCSNTGLVQWVYIDLEKPTKFDCMGIFWYKEYKPKKYNLIASNDLENWVYLYSDAIEIINSDYTQLNKTLTYRYVGLICLDKQSLFVVRELQIYSGIKIGFKCKNMKSYTYFILEKNLSEDLFNYEVNNIMTFIAYNQNILNITGLEYFANIQYIGLDDNLIKDITPLKNLKNLKTVTILNNNICIENTEGQCKINWEVYQKILQNNPEIKFSW